MLKSRGSFFFVIIFLLLLIQQPCIAHIADHQNQLLLSKSCNLDCNPKIESLDGNKASEAFANQSQQPTIIKKKKIVLVMCRGGYGHIAACQTLTDVLSPFYDVSTVDFIDTIYDSLDQVRTLTFGKANGNDMYNRLLQSGWIRLSNWLYRNIAPTAVLSKKKKIEKKTIAFLQKEKPDLLVSVLPIFNLPMSNAAKKLGIPFMLVTTDPDLTNWLLNLHKISHPNYLITINDKWPETAKQIQGRGISLEKVKKIGFPIRQDFLQKKNLPEIRKQWGIPDNKFVIMIMMGGAGSDVAYTYAKTIAEIKNINAHVLVCVGRNIQLSKKLSRIKPEPGISLSVIPFTKQISDLMAASHLLITKPGPGSINEAIHMKLPMLVDSTNPVLFWERANIAVVKNHNFGDVVKRFSQLEVLLDAYINNKEYYALIKANLENHAPDRFNEEIKKIVFDMCPVQ